jgi:structural maintenance of chromosome 2
MDPSVVRCKRPEFEIVKRDIFGRILIASDISIAKRVAFDPEVRVTVVTQEGGKVDPSGIMQGGTYRDRNSPFSQWVKNQTLSNLQSQVNKDKAAFYQEKDKNDSELKELKEKVEKKKSLMDEEDHLKKEFRNFNDNRRKNDIQKYQGLIMNKLQDMKKIENELKSLENQLFELVKKIEVYDSNSNGHEDIQNQLKMTEKDLEDLNNVLAETKRDYCRLQDKIQTFNKNKKTTEQEITEKNRRIDQKTQKIEEEKEALNQIESKLSQKGREVSNMKKDLENLQAETKELKGRLNEIETKLKGNISEIEETKKKMEDRNTNYEKALKQLENIGQKFSVQEKENMLKSAPSGRMEEETNPDKLRIRIVEIKDRMLEIEPKLNRNANNKNEILMEKMIELNEQKTLLKNNQLGLQEDISVMDEVSKDSYRKCFDTVNKNLGEMFAKFLPGAFAKMEEVGFDDQNKKKRGIKIRISFSGQWKESLTELSGGQRSLLALSFMLSMLKYKSAPFYILDEIDAAMDLSHTENIGDLISCYFPESQFLVISLKKGMYRSANVLFKTSLVEGKSCVTRIENKLVVQ